MKKEIWRMAMRAGPLLVMWPLILAANNPATEIKANPDEWIRRVIQ